MSYTEEDPEFFDENDANEELYDMDFEDFMDEEEDSMDFDLPPWYLHSYGDFEDTEEDRP